MDVVSLSSSIREALSSYYSSVSDSTESQSDSPTSSTETADSVLNSICDEYISSSEVDDTESCYTTYTNQWESLDTTLNTTELPAYVFNSFESKTSEVSAIESNLKNDQQLFEWGLQRRRC